MIVHVYDDSDGILDPLRVTGLEVHPKASLALRGDAPVTGRAHSVAYSAALYRLIAFARPDLIQHSIASHVWSSEPSTFVIWSGENRPST